MTFETARPLSRALDGALPRHGRLDGCADHFRYISSAFDPLGKFGDLPKHRQVCAFATDGVTEERAELSRVRMYRAVVVVPATGVAAATGKLETAKVTEVT